MSEIAMLKTVVYRAYKEYLMGDRSEELGRLLKRLREFGYDFLSVLSFARAIRGANFLSSKTCVMRVDVDSDPEYCWTLSRLFKENGCEATFYFRLETIDDNIMRDLQNEGFEVGYHYEELAAYAKQKHLKSPEEVMAKIEDCRCLFRENFAYFTKKLGSHSKTVAAHGDFANRKLGIANTVIVDDALKAELGIEAEAYDEDLVAKFNDSIIDGDPPNWWEPIGPERAAKDHETSNHCMRILLHPKQWRASIYWNTRQNIERVMQGLRY